MRAGAIRLVLDRYQDLRSRLERRNMEELGDVYSC